MSDCVFSRPLDCSVVLLTHSHTKPINTPSRLRHPTDNPGTRHVQSGHPLAELNARTTPLCRSCRPSLQRKRMREPPCQQRVVILEHSSVASCGGIESSLTLRWCW
ncbi:uncharacterized protein EKO05_0010985 [Ascochyta rabiei]|uniref:uncharacterized protein n=1 Tax=Didymella rabiei TaxID=5454 RepID=UPI0021FD0733|nr:uncharacterized protein EKO05_0010985 [Ascochyta rabiei]UPX20764.1 hypothetical protein EKO05_0010985 [Ascochyta rabiei]